MELRDEFAARAMASLVLAVFTNDDASESLIKMAEKKGVGEFDYIVTSAYEVADRMLAARGQECSEIAN